jgi:hypothetical protein
VTAPIRDALVDALEERVESGETYRAGEIADLCLETLANEIERALADAKGRCSAAELGQTQTISTAEAIEAVVLVLRAAVGE